MSSTSVVGANVKFLWLALTALLICNTARAEVKADVLRQALMGEVSTMVAKEDFGWLDNLAEALRKDKTRLPDGRWKMASFYDGLFDGMRELAKNDRKWQHFQAELAKFAAKRKDSASAWLLYASALDVGAWRLRGPGLASTVTPEGWSGFRSMVAKERQLLDAHKAQLAVNPQWYGERIRVAIYGGEGDAKIAALVEEGVHAEPLYYGIYFAGLIHRMPIWGGSLDAMAQYINESIKFTTPEEGSAMYARLLWYAYEWGGYSVAEHPAIDWLLVKQSISDVLRAYPDEWNTQWFFMMACDKPDKVEATRLLALIREPPSEALFRDNMKIFEACKSWASGKLEMFMMRDHETGALKMIK